MTTRRGFTLVEMLVALVLLVLVGGVVYQVLINQQRLTRTQTEQASLQSNVRTGALLVPSELRELGSGSLVAADIIHMDADSITYRAMRAIGTACLVTTSSLTLPLDRLFRSRMPDAARDSVLLFVENNPYISTDDVWLPLRVTAVVNGAACGVRPAINVVTGASTIPPGLLAGAVLLEAPIRTFEVMRIKRWNQGGQDWLGARSISAGEPYEAVLGPLTANGLSFTYRDSVGGVTALRERVRTIDVTIRGVTDRAVRTASGNGPLGLLQDSLITRVALRNAPRQ